MKLKPKSIEVACTAILINIVSHYGLEFAKCANRLILNLRAEGIILLASF